MMCASGAMRCGAWDAQRHSEGVKALGDEEKAARRPQLSVVKAEDRPAKIGHRPSKLTPAVHHAIVESVRAGTPIIHAAAAAGVTSTSTIYQWIAKGGKDPASPYAAFARDIKSAEADAVAKNVRIVLQAGEKSWQAAAWWLERTHPEEFARRDGLALGASSDVTVKVVVEGDWHGRGAKVVDVEAERS